MNTPLDKTTVPLELKRTVIHFAKMTDFKLLHWVPTYKALSIFCFSESPDTLRKRCEILDYIIDQTRIALSESYREEMIIESLRYIEPGAFPWEDYEPTLFDRSQKKFLIYTASILYGFDREDDAFFSSHLMVDLIDNLMNTKNDSALLDEINFNGLDYFKPDTDISSIFYIGYLSVFKPMSFKKINRVIPNSTCEFNVFQNILELFVQSTDESCYETRLNNLNTILGFIRLENFHPTPKRQPFLYWQKVFTINRAELVSFPQELRIELLCTVINITRSTGVTLEDELLFYYLFHRCEVSSWDVKHRNYFFTRSLDIPLS